jgi:ribose transport system substrate-binding protein
MGAAVVCLAALAGCGSDDDSDAGSSGASGTTTTTKAASVPFEGSLENGLPVCYPEPKPKALTIGFANPLDANETVNGEARAMKLETEKLGGKFINIDTKADIDLQVSAIEQLVARKADAIIVFPNDPKALNPALQKAKDAGIPVIGIDANLRGQDPGLYTSQVWQRRDEASYLQAKEAARLMPAGAGYAQVGFVVRVPTIEYSLERAKFWGDKFGLESLGRVDNPSDDIAGGEKAMTEVLSKYPDAKGVVAYNEESATGARSAARASGNRDVTLVGANGGSLGFASVKDGKIDATVQFDVPGIGKCAVWGAYDAAEGQTLPKTVLAAGAPRVITQENVGDTPSWDETLQQRYGKTK